MTIIGIWLSYRQHIRKGTNGLSIGGTHLENKEVHPIKRSDAWKLDETRYIPDLLRDDCHYKLVRCGAQQKREYHRAIA